MTTCPSGVDYMHLVDHARVHIEETGQRSFKERLIRALLAATLPYPDRFRLALRAARFARPFAGAAAPAGLAASWWRCWSWRPPACCAAPPSPGPAPPRPRPSARKRVILLAGCAQQVLRPEINDATIRLLARRGVDVEVAPGAGCCGALVHHMGREAGAIAMAKRNIDAWTRLIDKGDPVDAVIVNASGCGTTVKDYGHLLKREPKYAERAARIAGMARDVTEFLGSYEHGAAQALVVAAGRLSLRLLDAARPAHHRRAAQAPAQRRLHGGRGPRGPHVLRLGRHLQHPAAGDRRRAARPQGRQHQERAPRRRSPPATSAASRSWPAAWTSPSPTPSSCSTGPTAARCRAGWRRWPSTCKDVPEPKLLLAAR